jgi:hypothetical protein
MVKFSAIRSILVAALLSFTPAVSSAFVAITVAPPVLPVYDQPPCPGDGYIWTPGYWAWDYDVADYYWVPGVWVLAPRVGFLWTPGWWGWGGGGYVWNAGYWGPTVGFYGGINYGFGYFGSGFVGGRWEGNAFHYNTAVWHVDPAVHNTYADPSVINNRGANNRISYNGHGGIDARPTAAEQAATREHHLDPVDAQRQQELAARQDPAQRYSANHGQPKNMAMTTFRGAEQHGAAAVNGAGAHPEQQGAAARGAEQHGAVAANRAATNHARQGAAVTHRTGHTAAATRHAATAHVEHNTATQRAAHGIARTHQSAHVSMQAHRAASHGARPAVHAARGGAPHGGGGHGGGGHGGGGGGHKK